MQNTKLFIVSNMVPSVRFYLIKKKCAKGPAINVYYLCSACSLTCFSALDTNLLRSLTYSKRKEDDAQVTRFGVVSRLGYLRLHRSSTDAPAPDHWLWPQATVWPGRFWSPVSSFQRLLSASRFVLFRRCSGDRLALGTWVLVAWMDIQLHIPQKKKLAQDFNDHS
jgi:hypothetical protein